MPTAHSATPTAHAPSAPKCQLKNFSLALTLALAGMGNTQAQSLVDLYAKASQHDTAVLSARHQKAAAAAKAEQAKAGLRPQAGLAAGANWANVDTSASPSGSRAVDNQSLAISASTPLYRPANSFVRDQGQLGLDIAQAQLLAAEQDLIVRTAQAYFDLLAAQDTLNVVRAQKKAVAEQLAAAKVSFEVGTTTVTDTREAQARFDLVTALEIATDNDLLVKRLVLDQLVGTNNTAPKSLKPESELPTVQPEQVEAWVARAVETHPSIKQLNDAHSIAELEVKKAQAGHKPTLDLVGQYQVARAPSTVSPLPGNVRTNTASIGVQFNLPLFAGYAIQNRVKEALALVDKSHADRETASRKITQAVRSAFYGVVSGQGQVKALKAAEASSQSALEANQLGYQVGVRINIDVLNAQSQLFQTKRDLAQARYNVLVGQLRLKQASGSLNEADLAPINALLLP